MSTAIWTHRCEHVSPGQPGTVHDLGMGITAELCEKCRAELVTRLGEKPAPVELHLDFSPPRISDDARAGKVRQ